MDEVVVIQKILFLKGIIGTLQSDKKNEVVSAEFGELVNFISLLWAEFLVKDRETEKLVSKVNELESKLEMYGRFLGVQ